MLQSAAKLDLPYLIESSLIATEADYVNLQKLQLFVGKLSDGEMIHRLNVPYKGYAFTTIQQKERKGQPTDRITLKDTGDFYSQIFSDPRAEGIIVDSGDSKSAILKEAYGEKIFGLDDDSKQQYVNVVQPVLIDEVQKELNR